MKSNSQHLLATAAFVAIGRSAALKSSVRGGANSDNAELTSRDLPRRSLHQAVTSQQNERQALDATQYWWLGKRSSEKDAVYIPNDEEMQVVSSNVEEESAQTASGGKSSFSVFTIEVDNNPDTSGLPYRAPSKYPTARPTNAPVESGSPTVAIEQVLQFTEKLNASDRGTAYHYPIWADTFKGCTSSSTAPNAYTSNPSEYLFSSEALCCDFWFDSQDCGSRVNRDGSMVMNYAGNSDNVDEFGTMDEYMFRMNGIEAFSGGGATSEDSGSGDTGDEDAGTEEAEDTTAAPSPTSPSEISYPPPTASVEASTSPTAATSSTPTYAPTPFERESTEPEVNVTDVPDTGDSDNATASSPPPTPATVTTTDYTPYPTYADMPVATLPPVFEVSTATNSPSAAAGNETATATASPVGTGSTNSPSVAGDGTAPPVQSAFTPEPTLAGSTGISTGGTPWPTFSDSFENSSAGSASASTAGTAAATTEGTTAGSTEGTAAATTAGSEAATTTGSTAATTPGSEAASTASSSTNMTTLLAFYPGSQKSERTAEEIYIFDEDSGEGGISPLLNLHDEGSSAGWDIVEVGTGVAYDGAFTLMTSSQRIAGTNTSMAKRLFMPHVKRNVAIVGGNAKMSVTISSGANGGSLEFAVMSTVSYPLDALEIGVDGSPVTSIKEVSKDWQAHTLELTPGDHTIYFNHIVNPMNLPQAELEQSSYPDGYQGISQVDGIFYTDNT